MGTLSMLKTIKGAKICMYAVAPCTAKIRSNIYFVFIQFNTAGSLGYKLKLCHLLNIFNGAKSFVIQASSLV